MIVEAESFFRPGISAGLRRRRAARMSAAFIRAREVRREVVTAQNAQYTDFSLDVIGRYICNGLDEALHSADRHGNRPNGESQEDARPFDVIVVGGGS